VGIKDSLLDLVPVLVDKLAPSGSSSFECSYRGIIRAMGVKGWQVLTRDIKARKTVLDS
jgi:hypothetical protein